MNTVATLTFDQAIEQVGFGRFQKKLMVVCGLGWAADAMEVLLISFALPAISQEWNLTNAQKGLLGTAIFLGMLAGAWVWGRLSDLAGRKIGFVSTVAIDSVFGLASAFAPTFGWLVGLRALTGFGVGGTLPVDYAIFAEYLPANKRGRYLVLLESFWALGAVFAAGLAWLIVPTLGWRWLLGISAVPGLIIFFIRRFVPESPRYLVVNGKTEQAAEVLRQVARENGRDLPAFRLAAGGSACQVTLSRPAAARAAAHDLAAVADLVCHFAGILRRVHLAAGLLPLHGDDPAAGLPECLHPGAGAAPGLFLGGMAGGALGAAQNAGLLPGRQRAVHLFVRGGQLAQLGGGHGHLDVVLHPGGVGGAVCLHP